MPLTDVEIRRAKTKDKAYRMSDSGSLYLWVTPSGGKLWRWAYTHEGKEKLMAFGKYPDVPLVLARERHAEARKLLAIGTDPMEQRQADDATVWNHTFTTGFPAGTYCNVVHGALSGGKCTSDTVTVNSRGQATLSIPTNSSGTSLVPAVAIYTGQKE
ncbi:MAG: integrase arm-type DNA-binding domain-containing protein [Terracidiphilus sp.]